MKFKKPALAHFISEPITVDFPSTPAFSKKPNCPSTFTWQGKTYIVIVCLSEWSDFTRHGRMVKNMQPQHAEVASKRGSWGVGKYFFDVRTENQRIFRLYYDRAPKDALDRMGQWILLAELTQEVE